MLLFDREELEVVEWYIHLDKKWIQEEDDYYPIVTFWNYPDRKIYGKSYDEHCKIKNMNGGANSHLQKDPKRVKSIVERMYEKNAVKIKDRRDNIIDNFSSYDKISYQVKVIETGYLFYYLNNYKLGRWVLSFFEFLDQTGLLKVWMSFLSLVVGLLALIISLF